LRKSEARYRSIVENINDGMIIHDFAGTILEVNENTCLIHGYSHDEMIGMHLGTLCCAEDARMVKQRLACLVETGSLVFDGEHVRNDGSPVAINMSARVVSRAGAGVVQSFVRDMSAVRKMEAELIKKDKLESLGILAGGIAHDFNNLLSAMFGFMDLARMAMKPGDEAHDYLTKAFTGFERAKRLSQQLLTFSKGGSPVKQVVSIAVVTKDTGELALSGSNIRIVYELASGLPAVEADPHQLSQVFSNLLINARQAMPDGGTVTITAENRQYDGAGAVPLPAGNYVVIALRDEGVGIPEKIISRIFDPFFTTKQQGSGLGLSICFSIIKKHGGHITVSSAPGEGAVFTVWLPAAPQAVTGAAEAPDLSVLRGRGRILVMDDEPSILEITSVMLQSAGYDVATAADSAKAIEEYREAWSARAPFDLVVLDLTVPGGMGGEKALAGLLEINPKVKAIVSSGYADTTLLSDFKSYGFASMVAKPYTVGELLSVVKKTLGIGNKDLP
jgi:PAS domain S-box-containing protein